MAGGDESNNSKRVRTRTARVATREMFATTARTGDESWVVIYAANPAATSRRFAFTASKPAYVVGRSGECDILIDSNAASRKHCCIERLEDAWWVLDLGSLNGTYVNDTRITKHRLAHGDRIQVGDTIFKHLSGDGADAAYLEAIRSALVTDGLTQAWNDRAFRDALSTAVTRAATEGTAVSLALADLDFFKRVNDEHGHPAGDRVLREFARMVMMCVPGDVGVARVGGEEFALLAVGRPRASLAALAEGARAAIAAHSFRTPAGVLRLTVSFGVTQFDGTESDKALFERADQLLYAAKHAGRNRVVY